MYTHTTLDICIHTTLLYTLILCTPTYTRMHRYHNGNDQDQGQIRGFGHVGYLTPDLTLACEYLEEQGVAFKKKPTVRI